VTIKSQTFSGISGADGVCGLGLSETKSCGIYLQNNNIVKVERHAFAWMKRLQVFLGESPVPLVIEAYAFYGARWIPRLRISCVPTLTLHPRIFTNTEYLEYVEISGTQMEKLDGFIFEGLKNVKGITFNRVHVPLIASYAFSGITFYQVAKPGQRDDEEERISRSLKTQEVSIQSVSFVNFTGCNLDQFQIDAFRDTKVTHIHIKDCRIKTIQANTFRGVFGLQSLRLIANSIPTLEKDSLGSLRNLRELILERNNISVIAGGAFTATSDIIYVHIVLGCDTTLEMEAFSGMYNIKDLQIYSTSAIKPTLVVRPGAFRNLVGVGTFRISSVRLPVLEGQSFSGMTRIKDFELVLCDITHIEHNAFGMMHINNGAIERIDMSVGNNLTCDCRTSPVLRELIHKFSSYKLSCRSSRSVNIMKRVDEESLSELSCGYATANAYICRSCALGTIFLTLAVAIISHVLQSLHVLFINYN